MTAIAMAHPYNGRTTKLPLHHYWRSATWFTAIAFGILTCCSSPAKYAEVVVGQLGLYFVIASLSELYTHRLIDDKILRQRRLTQSRQEIVISIEALLGVCGFSAAWSEFVDPVLCPTLDYFRHEPYTVTWCVFNIVVYLIICDTWFFWWHYAFHKVGALWPMHQQHHQIREPTAFGGPTVHVLELIAEYAICHHLIVYIMPMHPIIHRALGAFAFVFGAILNHSGLGGLDYNDHYAHHISWKGGRARYKNFALFFPWWDMLWGTHYNMVVARDASRRPNK